MGDVADVVDDSELVPAEGNSAISDGAPEAEPSVPARAAAFDEPSVREPAPHAAEPDSLTGQLAILLPDVVDAGAEPTAAEELADEPIAPQAAEAVAVAAVGATDAEAVPEDAPEPEPESEPEAEAEPEATGAEAAGDEAVSEDELPQDLAAVAKGLDEPDVVGEEVATAAEPGESSEAETEAAATSSLDEIEPGTVIQADAESAEAASAQLAVDSGSVPTWPFAVYVLVWLIAAGVGVWEFLQVPAGLAIFNNSMYATSIMAGIGLLILGPVLLLIVWAVTFFTRENARGGSLFVSAFIKGASATLLGAIIWMGALMLIDFLRVGRLL